MEIIISLLMTIILAFVYYKIIDEKGKSYTYWVIFIITMVFNLLSGELLTAIFSSLISALFNTIIYGWAYKTAQSLSGYFIRIILVNLVIGVVLVAGITVLGMSIMNSAMTPLY